ncbi:MAG: flagellin [Pseudomonadota bacterium]
MVSTNPSAKTALGNLRRVQSSLDDAQSRIATGLSVNSASDNPAYFLVASVQRADVTIIQGTRDNLQNAVGAITTASSAQDPINEAILNIKNGIITIETGFAEDEIERVIETQIDEVRDIISSASFNGVNLLDTRDNRSVIVGVDRSGGKFNFQTLNLRGAGLGRVPAPVNTVVTPPAGALIDLDSTTLFGAPGVIPTQDFGDVTGVNVGTNPAGVDERTFVISFETGADVTTEQVIYEEGGNIRGLNISVRDGLLVFGGYNLPNDGTTPWPYVEVQTPIEPNTRYTAQLVLDGDATATGEFQAYIDGILVDRAEGVGVLYDHGDNIGIGRIAGNAVVNGVVVTDTGAGPGGNRFQGSIDKILVYNQIFGEEDFDQLTSYLATDWLPVGQIAYYVGSDLRVDAASLVELLEAVIPIDQAGFSTEGALKVLDAAQQKLNTAFAQLGLFERRITGQRNYLQDLTDGLQQGVAALVEADLGEEAARIQSLQVQNQLVVQALQIANQQPATVLQLFSQN